MPPANRIFGFLKSFPRGINSNIDPLLLPPDQLSFATNVSVRGDFVTQRPNFYNLSLQGVTGDLSAFQTGIFQGACFYQTQTGGYIMAAVNGQLFQISIDSTSQIATVTKVTLPDSLQSTTVNQNWMWQAGSFLVWSDGVALPMFYDGNPQQLGAFRSTGPTPTLLGTTAASFTAPAQNQYVQGDISVVKQWTGGFAAILIGSALYYVQSYSGGAITGQTNVGLDGITWNAGDLIAPGTSLVLPQKYLGTIIGAAAASITGTTAGTAITNFPALPNPGTTGSEVQIKVLSSTASNPDSFAVGTAINSSKKYPGAILASTASTFPSAPNAATAAAQVTLTISGQVYNPSYFNCNYGSVVGYGSNAACVAAGDSITVGGVPVSVVSVNSGGLITSMVVQPTSQSNNGQSISGTISFSSHSVLTGGSQYPYSTGTSVLCGSLWYLQISSVSGVVSGVSYSPSASVWNAGTSAVPNQFTLTMSQSFAGAVGDSLNINGTTCIVQSFSGKNVTCAMPSGYVANGNIIPVWPTAGSVITDTTASSANTSYGTVSVITSTLAVQQTMLIPYTPVGTLSVGQTVEIITVGGGLIIGSVQSLSNGTVGASLNTFNLAMSAAVSSLVSVGNTLTIGNGSTFAQMSVYAIVNSTTIQCQMLNTPSVSLIPITSAVPTIYQILTNANNTGAPSVGTYPLNNGGTPPVPLANLQINTLNFTIPITPTNNTVANGQIVQMVTATGATDLFQVVSVSGGSTGTQPTIRVQNVNDIAGSVIPAGTSIYSLPELPICRMGCYGMGRNWVSLTDGVSYVASDIVGSSTGTQEYNYQDSVLKVSQNYFLAGASYTNNGALGGGSFQISAAGEKIAAMQFVAQLNAALGQGPLQIFTNATVFSNVAPADMATWSKLTSPIQIEGLIGSGAAGQNAVVQVNNDLIFRLADGGVQSMIMAEQNFNQWGNTPISEEISRIISGDNQSLISFTSMAVFNNRLLMTCQLQQSAARGVYGTKIAVLNFDPISSLAGKQQSVWEGQWTGLNVLQIITGVFNNQKQCFALCLSQTGMIEIHSIQLDVPQQATPQIGYDNGGAATGQPVTWSFESPMMFANQERPNAERTYKRLVNGDFSVKGLAADVDYQVFYRADQSDEWTLWYESTIVYQGASDTGYRRRIGIGQPNPNAFEKTNNQPLREGYDFQLQFVFTGYCVLTNARIAADIIPEPEFAKPI